MSSWCGANVALWLLLKWTGLALCSKFWTFRIWKGMIVSQRPGNARVVWTWELMLKAALRVRHAVWTWNVGDLHSRDESLAGSFSYHALWQRIGRRLLGTAAQGNAAARNIKSEQFRNPEVRWAAPCAPYERILPLNSAATSIAWKWEKKTNTEDGEEDDDDDKEHLA